MLLLLNISLVSASIDVEFNCHDKNCLEGTPIDYSFIIYNNIEKKIDIGDVFLKEKDTGKVIEYHYIGERIFPKEHKAFNFTSNIEAPLKGYTFYVYPCFTTVISNETEITEAGIVCGEVAKTFSVVPLSNIECESNKECSSGEYCNLDLFKCKPVKCKDSGVIINHRCIGSSIVYAAVIAIIVLGLVFVMAFVKQKRKKSKGEDDNQRNDESKDSEENEENGEENRENAESLD